MQDQLTGIEAQAVAELRAMTDVRSLEEWRVAYLGRSGRLTQVLRGLGSLPIEERRTVGAQANEVKRRLEALLEEKEAALRQTELARELEQGRIDVTLPGRPVPLGRLHPITQVVREICGTFQQLGFQVVEGPEVELDYYNFEALNIPPEHPAREMWDTFWIDTGEGERNVLLRTHTSPMQIRVMEQTRPPVRVVVPGRCYRYEATDATHESIFYQIEGLAVDRAMTMADLKGVLAEFARRMFGQNRRVRFRCDYFPFVEPGVEVSIDCFGCNGMGCNICRDAGWIEIMGAGMVHPKVLERVNYDPVEYTGFAFGMGPERVAMLRYGIDDIRLFYANDIRFLRQF
ncbi:MAG: phenylalanine--tRNA ligase subunit alpha [Chloroflexi bacterium]|nr:phenylalanine--tRNA ligase subunit alpha [Chloroflexota bacterium]